MTRRIFTRLLAVLGIGTIAGPVAARNVTWNELFSETPDIPYDKIFALWSAAIAVPSKMAPIGMSAFGAIFFLREESTVHCLDPLVGSIRQVASDPSDFKAKMNSETWQVENLLSKLVAQLELSNVRKPNQVYGLAPHPNFVGEVSLQKSRVMVMDAYIWHSVSFQSFYRTQ